VSSTSAVLTDIFLPLLFK